jgi:hypothetical protein
MLLEGRHAVVCGGHGRRASGRLRGDPVRCSGRQRCRIADRCARSTQDSGGGAPPSQHACRRRPANDLSHFVEGITKDIVQDERDALGWSHRFEHHAGFDGLLLLSGHGIPAGVGLLCDILSIGQGAAESVREIDQLTPLAHARAQARIQPAVSWLRLGDHCVADCRSYLPSRVRRDIAPNCEVRVRRDIAPNCEVDASRHIPRGYVVVIAETNTIPRTGSSATS